MGGVRLGCVSVSGEKRPCWCTALVCRTFSRIVTLQQMRREQGLGGFGGDVPIPTPQETHGYPNTRAPRAAARLPQAADDLAAIQGLRAELVTAQGATQGPKRETLLK